MRIVFFGTPEFAVPSLQRLLAEPDIEVVAVVTQPDRRRGRGSQVMPSPVKQVAAAADCPVYQPQRIKREPAILEALGQLQADFFVVVAYGQILSQAILDIPRLGCINAHGSLLPTYRGAAPIQWCLYHGESVTGVTTMAMDAGMDTGAMVETGEVTIDLLENAWELGARLSQLSAELLMSTLRGLGAGQLTATPQDEAAATYAPLIQKSDFEVDWRRSAIATHNQVRGFYPNAVASWQGQPVKILATAPLGDDYWPRLPEALAALQETAEGLLLSAGGTLPGEILGLLKHQGPLVQTGDGPLLLLQVKPQGKRALSGWDFANGSRLQVGDRFDWPD